MKLSASIKATRDSITKMFAEGQFTKGLVTLKGNAALPDVVVKECVGNFHFYKREIPQAIKSYEGAISADPDYPISRYQYLMGVKEERKKDFVAAFKRYQHAIEIEPDFPDAYVELGGLLVKIGDYEGAARCYRDAIRLVPDNVENYYNLRAVLTKLSSQEPAKYAQELATTQATYERLTQAGATLPKRPRQW